MDKELKEKIMQEAINSSEEIEEGTYTDDFYNDDSRRMISIYDLERILENISEGVEDPDIMQETINEARRRREIASLIETDSLNVENLQKIQTGSLDYDKVLDGEYEDDLPVLNLNRMKEEEI